MTVAEGGVLATRCPAMSGQCVVEALWSTWALCAGHHTTTTSAKVEVWPVLRPTPPLSAITTLTTTFPFMFSQHLHPAHSRTGPASF